MGNQRSLSFFIGIFTLVLWIFGVSINQEWYLEVGLLKYVPDTGLMKTVDKIVQNVQLASIICIFIAVTLKQRHNFLKLLAIKVYILCQFIAMICCLAAATILINRSSCTMYQEWQRINMAVTGGIYLTCVLTEIGFIFVAGKFHGNSKAETIQII